MIIAKPFAVNLLKSACNRFSIAAPKPFNHSSVITVQCVALRCVNHQFAVMASRLQSQFTTSVNLRLMQSEEEEEETSTSTIRKIIRLSLLYKHFSCSVVCAYFSFSATYFSTKKKKKTLFYFCLFSFRFLYSFSFKLFRISCKQIKYFVWEIFLWIFCRVFIDIKFCIAEKRIDHTSLTF